MRRKWTSEGVEVVSWRVEVMFEIVLSVREDAKKLLSEMQAVLGLNHSSSSAHGGKVVHVIVYHHQVPHGDPCTVSNVKAKTIVNGQHR